MKTLQILSIIGLLLQFHLYSSEQQVIQDTWQRRTVCRFVEKNSQGPPKEIDTFITTVEESVSDHEEDREDVKKGKNHLLTKTRSLRQSWPATQKFALACVSLGYNKAKQDPDKAVAYMKTFL